MFFYVIIIKKTTIDKLNEKQKQNKKTLIVERNKIYDKKNKYYLLMHCIHYYTPNLIRCWIFKKINMRKLQIK